MSRSKTGEGVLGSIKVLLVDDEPSQMEMTQLSLVSVDPLLEITSVANPREALSRLVKGTFECVVSDYQMPELDGIQLCTEIRKTSTIPLIIYTGRGSEEVASRAFAAGVDDYVRKEMGLGHYRVLAKRIRHAVERRRAEENLRALEQRDRELLDSISDGFFALDSEYRYTYSNERSASNVGYEPDDLVGRNIWETFPRLLGTTQEVNYRGAMEKREIRRFRTKGVLTEKIYDFSVYPSADGISVFWSDITEQNAGEEELAKRGELRRSGIELIGYVPWGTNFCQFYQTKQDLLDILVPYFKAGLEGNELCMWVTAEPLLAEDARRAMEEAVPGFSKYLEKGQIEIISYRDWYLKEGGFDSDRVLKGWIDKHDTACGRGFAGLRLTGNTFWLEKEQWKAFTDYEKAVNDIISQYNMVALCTYSLEKCDAKEILDVVKNHQFALIKREGEWELIESGDQRKIEGALKVSEERYRRIVETAHEGIAIGAPDGGFTFVNQRFADMLGYGREEIIGKGVLDFMDEVERQRVLGVKEALRRGESYQGEARFKRRDGSVLWTLVGSSPLYDADGRHVGNLAMHSDITQRKLDEQALLKAKLEWERTFDTVPDLIAVLDSKHHIVRANRSMAKTLGVASDACIGLSCYECVHGAAAPPGFCPHSKTLLDGLEHTAEVYEPRLGGYFIVSTTPLKDEGGRVVGSVHVARDITERKKAEEKITKANEELITSNTELEATNDELLTARERLQDYANEMERLVEERTGEIIEANKKLRETSLYSRSLLEASIDLLVTISADGKITDVNRATEDATGVPRDRLIGTDFAEYFTEPEKARRGYRRVFEEGQVRDYPLSILHNTGKTTDVLYNATIYRNAAGDIVGVFADARDVTEQRRAEQRIRESSLYARSLLESSLDPLVTISAEGKITDVNAATEAVTGVSRDLLIGTDFSNYFTEPERAREGYEKVFSEGSVRDYPLAIRHASGRLTEVLYNATVYRNETGEVQGVFAAARDITGKKRLEEEVELSHERLEAFMESATDGFSIWDSEIRLLDANDAWMRRWQDGLSKADLIGKRLTELYPGVEASPRYGEYLRVLETGRPFSFEGVLSGPLVKKRIFLGRVFRVGSGLGMVSADVTDARAMEERLREAQRGEDIDRISAMVAHDVRNPLMTAAQALEMARGAPGNAEALYALAGRNVSRAIEMIEELRENTRLIKPRIAEVNLRLLVEDTIREQPPGEGVVADCSFGEGLEGVGVDPALIRRVLENLLGNAVEAMPNGGRVRVRAWGEEGDVLLSVSDTGVGIPDEAAPMIFTPLYTTKAKGVGMGLSFCKRAVEAHGGAIGFASKPGEGTTFTVRLPDARRA